VVFAKGNTLGNEIDKSHNEPKAEVLGEDWTCKEFLKKREKELAKTPID
jgi:hypothetical protein